MKLSTVAATLLPLLTPVMSVNPPIDKYVELVADAAGNCFLQFSNWGTDERPCTVTTAPIGTVDQATSKCKAFDGSARSPPVPSCNNNVNTLIYSGQYHGGIYVDAGWLATRVPLGTKVGCRTYMLPYESPEQPGEEWVQNGCDIDPQLISSYTQWYDRQ
ncbi:hypothetical protein VTN49DRAFT_2871 [Thermomyces lanuginosus]|uniref:uncharacterized protein n=1 Tax=Thermomyces lanuginosus TaxID=5541 RepID=UPI003743284B